MICTDFIEFVTKRPVKNSQVRHGLQQFCINPLNPKSVQHLVSPENNTAESFI